MMFQEFCVRQIKNALDLGLTQEQLDSPAYKYALKGGLVRLYAETYYLEDQDCEFKFWKLDFGSNRTVHGYRVWESLLCSKDAYRACEKMENRRSKARLHYEHIEPAGVTYAKLLDLNGKNPGEDQIKAILDCSKLVLLTKKEVRYLDDSRYSTFIPADKTLIKDWCTAGFISQDIQNETLDSMGQSTRDSGNAYARLAHLARHEIQFVWGKPSEIPQGKLIAEYLKDTNHTISGAPCQTAVSKRRGK